jgi:hypothetical protein
MIRRLFLAVMLVSTLSGIVSAQSSATVIMRDSAAKASSYATVGVRYTSDYYYMGRSDSAKAPYLTTSIAYYHRSGLFARGTLSYLTLSENGRVDLFTFSGGYSYFGKKFAGGLSVTEYFFSDLSYAVQAEMRTYVNAFTAYDFSGFLLYADGSLGLSKETDVFAGIELSRIFYLLKDRLQIIPAVAANAGTQRYVSIYAAERSTSTGSGMRKGKHRQGSGGSTTPALYVTETEKFRLLDYEASLMVVWKVKALAFTLSANWLFPQNAAEIVSDNVVYEEDLKNGFFWAAGARIRVSKR